MRARSHIHKQKKPYEYFGGGHDSAAHAISMAANSSTVEARTDAGDVDDHDENSDDVRTDSMRTAMVFGDEYTFNLQ